MRDKLHNVGEGRASSFILGMQVNPKVPAIVNLVNLSCHGASINLPKISKTAAYDDTWVFNRNVNILTLGHPEMSMQGTDYSFNLIFASNIKRIMTDEILFWVTDDEDILTIAFAAGIDTNGTGLTAVVRLPRTAYYQIGSTYYSGVTGKPLNDNSLIHNIKLRHSITLNSIVNRQYI